MGDEKYKLQFEAFGLEIKPLPSNYTPDDYARRLMSGVLQRPDISYSDRTDYTGEKKNCAPRMSAN
ncbi:MAG: hypothetical protein IK077_07400 [Thermoguttaceae bacterium]|nr:hypothetical protein [Thermoguttaceae bacterium]